MTEGPWFRPVITVVRPAPDDSVIEVTLDMDGWIADGLADVVNDDLLAAACEATCAAVNSFLQGDATVSFVRCHYLEGHEYPRRVVLSVVRFLEAEGASEELLGAAWVRSDLQVAGVRATLDGLTRRLAPHVGDL